MDFEFHFTKEHEEFRKEVRIFIKENAFKESMTDLNFPPPDLYKKGREQQRKLGSKGWFAPAYPKEYGGGGLAVEQCVILLEEFSKISEERRWLLKTEIDAQYPAGIMVHGTNDQKRRFLPPLLRSEIDVWQCFTEPEAGTDEANMKSTAVRDKDAYIVNGTKLFVGHSPPPIYPDYLYWPAVTGLNAPRRENLSAFFIPGDLPGITYQPMHLIGTETERYQVFCEDVRCPAEYLIGEENKGWLVISAALASEHGGAGSLAPRNRFVLRFIDYCKKTKHNGQPLSKDPRVQDILVQIYIEHQVGRLWGLRNFAMAQGQIPRIRYTGTQGTLHRRLLAPQIGKAILDILGPLALIDDPELRVLAGEVEHEIVRGDVTHRGGTPEAQKILMSRGLGLGRGAARAARQ